MLPATAAAHLGLPWQLSSISLAPGALPHSAVDGRVADWARTFGSSPQRAALSALQGWSCCECLSPPSQCHASLGHRTSTQGSHSYTVGGPQLPGWSPPTHWLLLLPLCLPPSMAPRTGLTDHLRLEAPVRLGEFSGAALPPAGQYTQQQPAFLPIDLSYSRHSLPSAPPPRISYPSPGLQHPHPDPPAGDHPRQRAAPDGPLLGSPTRPALLEYDCGWFGVAILVIFLQMTESLLP